MNVRFGSFNLYIRSTGEISTSMSFDIPAMGTLSMHEVILPQNVLDVLNEFANETFKRRNAASLLPQLGLETVTAVH